MTLNKSRTVLFIFGSEGYESYLDYTQLAEEIEHKFFNSISSYIETNGFHSNIIDSSGSTFASFKLYCRMNSHRNLQGYKLTIPYDSIGLVLETIRNDEDGFLEMIKEKGIQPERL